MTGEGEDKGVVYCEMQGRETKCDSLVDRAILDLGALAMSKDPGPTHVDPHCGFGRVLDADGSPLDGVHLVGLSQEHGKLRGDGVGALKVGQRVRVVPNHSCLTMACFDRAHTTAGLRVTGSISPCRGW